jgi:hypothetical protein
LPKIKETINMNTQVKSRKIWEKPMVHTLSVKTTTTHGTSYAPNESIGSDKYSPRNRNSSFDISS